jgi:sulfur-carrier protein adenylyltransferase/sulfurtransferase
MFTKEELIRYNKQMMLPEIKKSGQEKLKQARVLVVGAGGLGCPALQYLAAAGVGTIGIIDFDVVDASNLHRQLLYTIADVGKPKAVVASEKLRNINPHISVIEINEKLTNENALAIISDYDIIVDATDNFGSRYVINDACVAADKPFVYGGIHKFEGQLCVFNYTNANGEYGATYRCAFPEKEDITLNLNCADIGVIGVLPGTIGTMQATEVIKIITGIGEVCSSKLLIYNTLHNTINYVGVER